MSLFTEAKERLQRALSKQRAEDKRDAQILAELFGISGDQLTPKQKLADERLRKMCGYDQPRFVFRKDQPADPIKAAYYDGCAYMYRYIHDFIDRNLKPETEEE